MSEPDDTEYQQKICPYCGKRCDCQDALCDWCGWEFDVEVEE